MSDCAWLSDRMPAVALGRSVWSVDEATHLAHCADCQRESDLVRRSVHLGADLAGELDSATTARVVLQRLRADRENLRMRRRSWTFAALASAAAVAAVLWGGRPVASPLMVIPPPRATAALPMPLPELDNLQPGELNAVLQSMDEPYMGDSNDSSAADDLDDEVLDGGYDIWEG
jgi:hypothetical protein